jgi:hypothetical protein
MFNNNHEIKKFVDVSPGESKDIELKMPIGKYTLDVFSYKKRAWKLYVF